LPSFSLVDMRDVEQVLRSQQDWRAPAIGTGNKGKRGKRRKRREKKKKSPAL